MFSYYFPRRRPYINWCKQTRAHLTAFTMFISLSTSSVRSCMKKVPRSIIQDMLKRLWNKIFCKIVIAYLYTNRFHKRHSVVLEGIRGIQNRVCSENDWGHELHDTTSHLESTLNILSREFSFLSVLKHQARRTKKYYTLLCLSQLDKKMSLVMTLLTRSGLVTGMIVWWR